MDTLNIKNAVAAAAAAWGVQDYEIAIDTEESAGAEALKEEISTVSYSRSSTMRVRCVVAGRSGYASSELVTAEEAAALVEQAYLNAQAVDDEDTLELFAGSECYARDTRPMPELPDAEWLKNQALTLQKLANSADEKIVDGTQCFASGLRVGNYLINSRGLDVGYECALVYQGVDAAVKDGEEAADAARVASAAAETPEQSVSRAVSAALSKLGASSVPSGKYDIILAKEALRNLLATYAEVFSARSAYLKTTRLAGMEGKTVAAACVSLLDDPFHPGLFSHRPYDGEGVAVKTKAVIENGELKTLLYNRMYAHLMEKETTGNAAGAKTIAPLGLYFAPGTCSEEELLQKLGDGLYITALNGLHAGTNTQSGDFSLQAEGFRVENGKKTAPIKEFTVADNFFNLLRKVDGLADSVEFGVGSSFGAPDTLVRRVAVSGK